MFARTCQILALVWKTEDSFVLNAGIAVVNHGRISAIVLRIVNNVLISISHASQVREISTDEESLPLRLRYAVALAKASFAKLQRDYGVTKSAKVCESELRQATLKGFIFIIFSTK